MPHPKEDALIDWVREQECLWDIKQSDYRMKTNKHLGRHSHEVHEGYGVLMTELDKKLVIQAELSSHPDLGPGPHRSATMFSSSSSSALDVLGDGKLVRVIFMLMNGQKILNTVSLSILHL